MVTRCTTFPIAHTVSHVLSIIITIVNRRSIIVCLSKCSHCLFCYLRKNGSFSILFGILFLFPFCPFLHLFYVCFFSALSAPLHSLPILGDHVEETERENETTQHGAFHGAVTGRTAGTAGTTPGS